MVRCVVAAVLLVVFSSCSLLGGGGGGGGGSTPTGTVISPTVVLTGANSADYQVVSAAIGMSSSSSGYVYGAIKIHYLGTTDRSYIAVAATFKNAAGAVLWTDSSYVRNLTTCYSSSSSNNNTFFTDTYDMGYYRIIDNLNTYGVKLASVATVELNLTHSSYTYAAPFGTVSLKTGITSAGTTWTQTVKNDGATTVANGLPTLFFADGDGLVYLWDFPSLHVAGAYSANLAAGATGDLVSYTSKPDYLKSAIHPSEMAYDWDYPAPGSPQIVAARALAAVDKDAANLAVRQALDAATDAQRTP
jgi:hypothetical protein